MAIRQKERVTTVKFWSVEKYKKKLHFIVNVLYSRRVLWCGVFVPTQNVQKVMTTRDNN